MQIEHRIINRQSQPFIVADISSNHGQDLNTAHLLIDTAKACGVDAVKFQTYRPESMSVKEGYVENYYKYLPWKWHEELFTHCRQVGLIPFSSVFCLKGLEFLEKLGCPAYKIASFEKDHYPLLRAVGETGKPMILSNGMMNFSYLNHIDLRLPSISTAVLHCVSQYPAVPSQYHLKTLVDMRKNFGFEIGLSDHTSGTAVSIASVALGATIIERHFTLKRDGLVDDCVSLNPKEMQYLVHSCKEVWEARGVAEYSTEGDRTHLRSLWCIKDVKKGDRFSSENVGILRPNDGISATQYDNFIDKKASCDIKRGEPLHMRHLS